MGQARRAGRELTGQKLICDHCGEPELDPDELWEIWVHRSPMLIRMEASVWLTDKGAVATTGAFAHECGRGATPEAAVKNLKHKLERGARPA
jgi:hypothetical protein